MAEAPPRILKICQEKKTRLILLEGNLGSGKTVLIRGLAKTLKVKNWVKSPSFVLIQEYSIPKNAPWRRLIHLDLYRIDKPGALAGLGLGDYLEDQQNLIAVEWAERLPPALLKSRRALRIQFKPGPEPEERQIFSEVLDE